MISLSFTLISTAADICAFMVLRLILRPLIGEGTVYFSLAQDMFLLFYLGYAVPLRFSVCRESMKVSDRGGDPENILKPCVGIGVLIGILYCLLLAVFAEIISVKLFSMPYMYLSVLMTAPAVLLTMIACPFWAVVDAFTDAGAYMIRTLVRFVLIPVPSYIMALMGRNYGSKISQILMNPKEAEILGSAGAALGFSAGFLLIAVFYFILTPSALRKSRKKTPVAIDPKKIPALPSVLSTFLPAVFPGNVFMACVLVLLSFCGRSEEVTITDIFWVVVGLDPYVIITAGLACCVASLYMVHPMETVSSNERKKYGPRLSRSMRYAMAFSAPFSAVCCALAVPLQRLTVGGNDIPGYIQIFLAVLAPLAMITMMLYFVSFEDYTYPMATIVITASFIFAHLAGLVFFDRAKGNGPYIIVLVYCLGFVLSSVILVILRDISGRGRIRLRDLLVPLFAGIVLTVAAYIIRLLVDNLAGALTAVLVDIFLIYFIWLILMRVFRILSADTVERFPGGSIAIMFGGEED
ncbi:MAG: hypothetical protein K6E33_09800 [Lachnospiraceae bacterium]|nr:hypothetical protein [Lachnospiraceae bacterium]